MVHYEPVYISSLTSAFLGCRSLSRFFTAWQHLNGEGVSGDHNLSLHYVHLGAQCLFTLSALIRDIGMGTGAQWFGQVAGA
ncbi:hypothetical protein XELAEV_18024797mg [Xenopus laevis]|uniref:Uncharacterized protein n=1 Tax=Xenopus laevis TaxID=8355 RepID=A0A974D163_XENLA|nr:hypothetical protein XELAEV_18024797mg [Xenopus laevis]